MDIILKLKIVRETACCFFPFGTYAQFLSFIYLSLLILFFFQPRLAIVEQMGITQIDRLKTDFNYKQWRLQKSDQISNDQLQQAVWPFVWRSRFRLRNSELKMTLVTRFATMHRQTENASQKITTNNQTEPLPAKQHLVGLADTQVTFDYHFKRKAHILSNWFIGLGLSLPTGKNRLQPTEVELANQFYSEILDFQVSRLGEGFNAGISLFTVHRFSTLHLAIGGNYLAKGKYVILPERTYNPGNESQIQTVTLWQGKFFSWRNSLGFRRYSPDHFLQQIWFQQGGEILVATGLKLNFPRGQIFVEQHLTNRLRNQQIEGMNFGIQIRNTNSNFRRSRLGGRYRISPVTEIELLYERSFILPNENQSGRASTRSTSFSIAAQFRDHIWTNAGFSLGQGEMQSLQFSSTKKTHLSFTNSRSQHQIRLNGYSFWFGLRQHFDSH